MRFLFYTHSLVSDWNHGNAHFLRGVMRELIADGHDARAMEPAGGWSRSNLVSSEGERAEARFAEDFPMLRSESYGPDFDHEAAVAAADVVVVHEWADPELVASLGRLRRRHRFCLLFHDTHHRAVSDREAIAGMMLADYDGVLAFGETLSERYRAAGWGRRVFTWHEAADTALFRPLAGVARDADLIWIGNWGDDERSREIMSFLVEPAARLGLSGSVRGVRYPEAAKDAIAAAGLAYGGWIANADAPAAFARHRFTVHIPRRPYVESLPGIPTIRVFEALAAGIPLISAPWSDAEGLFRDGDFLRVTDGEAMTAAMALLRDDPAAAAELAARGRETVLARHSCRHRVEELFAILGALDVIGAEGRSDEPEAGREAAE